MAETDPNYDRWRGEISTQVRSHERRITEHDADIRELRVNANAATMGLARVEATIEGLRGDITRALTDQAKQRQDEFSQLQSAVAGSRITPKERVLWVILPLTLSIIGAVVVLLSTHTIG